MFPVFVSSGARGQHLIERSLRLDGVSNYLSWTPPRAASDPRRWTRSLWFKRRRLDGVQNLLQAGPSRRAELRFSPDGFMYIGDNPAVLYSERVFRDTAGWTHWHEENDSTQANALHRRRIWINGVEETAWTLERRALLIRRNTAEALFLQSAVPHHLGRSFYGYGAFYIAEFTALDGRAPGGPEGVTGGADINGVWSPIDLSELDYGANGFRLDFSRAPGDTSGDTSGDGYGLGTDVSGAGNHWTEHNITADDAAADTPSSWAGLAPPRVEDVRELYQGVHIPAGAAESDLAAARKGWGGYAEIFKSRSAPGPWRLRFSHDAAHEYTWGASGGSESGTAASAVRAPRTVLSGDAMTSGYAFRTGRRFGTAAGSVRHTQGAPTTVTHNLGHARGVVLVFRRTGTHDALMHHPDCAPGHLLSFGRRSGPHAHSGVTNVTADSFDVGAVMPSDTYDYLVMTEASGCFAAGAYTGNRAADGPYVRLGLSPAFLCVISGGAGTVRDALRDRFNPSVNVLRLETAQAETADGAKDILADGFKVRTSNSGANTSGVKHFVFAFGQPFAAGARAR
ncbi:MAG: DUF7483 domain-containing protein [Rhodospirillales bacterium]